MTPRGRHAPVDGRGPQGVTAVSITVRWREDEAFTFRCDPRQIARRLDRAELLTLLGDVPLQHIGLRDELRCMQCHQHPTSAWPTWQKE